jgi:hypothetical protein
MTMTDVKETLGVSESKAYKIIRQLNNEMKEKGFYTISGRVSRKYFEEVFYGIARAE